MSTGRLRFKVDWPYQMDWDADRPRLLILDTDGLPVRRVPVTDSAGMCLYGFVRYRTYLVLAFTRHLPVWSRPVEAG